MKNRLHLLIGSVILALAAVLALTPNVARADASGTIYNVPAFPLQQITGGPGPGTVSNPPYAATITIGTNSENQGMVQQINGVSTVSATSTVSAGTGGLFGQFLIIICSASASGNVTYTFSTSFLPTATVVATQGKSITVGWVSDGVIWHEMFRSASAQ